MSIDVSELSDDNHVNFHIPVYAVHWESKDLLASLYSEQTHEVY